MKQKILSAFKTMDVVLLSNLLEDDRSYMNVSKDLFLKRLNEEFDKAKKENCHSFDEIFFGVCGTCNKGCEGVSLISNTGHFLDLFFEEDELGNVLDIYVCNDLTNFVNLKKTKRLFMFFMKDEEMDFKPSYSYKKVENLSTELFLGGEKFNGITNLETIDTWYEQFKEIEEEVSEGFTPFGNLVYKLYSRVSDHILAYKQVTNIVEESIIAEDSIIAYHSIKSERELLKWYYENERNENLLAFFNISERYYSNGILQFSNRTLNITLDVTNYKYVIDYFQNVTAVKDYFMTKYKPSSQQFRDMPADFIDYSVTSFLKIQNKYLDIVEEYTNQSL